MPCLNRKNRAAKNVDLETIDTNRGTKAWKPKAKDLKTIRKLSAIQCTQAEIAAGVGVPLPTLEGILKRARDFLFASAENPALRPDKAERIGLQVYHEIEDGRAHGTTSLRSSQFRMALGGNTQMSIHLGKQYLGHSDKQELTGKDGQPLNQPPEVTVNFVGAGEEGD